MGSLFSGSGGFEVASKTVGIEPIWNSEIEPFPCLVVHKHFPSVVNFGDISKIKGSEVPSVDILTFGSPCQDLSISGKRQGLDGKKSNLFYEAIRIIKEMREATNNEYPRWIVWENVCGAFSSNKGEDFRRVLEEIVKIKNPQASISRPAKWGNSGEILGDDFSICWRVLDSRYFGVPQRRKRVFLVADFHGTSANEILFEKEKTQRVYSESTPENKRVVRRNDESLSKIKEHGIYLRLGIAKDKKTGLVDTKVDVSSTLIVSYDPFSNQGGVIVLSESPNENVLLDDTRNAYVRSFSPQELAMIQGFPYDYCSDVTIENPTQDDLVYFRRVFDTYCEIYNIKKKTDKQIITWLKDKNKDRAEYKMWGNGVSLPVVEYIMNGFVLYHNSQNKKT